MAQPAIAASEHHSSRYGVMLIALAALLWSSGGLGIKAIGDSGLTVTVFRSLFAAITLFVFFRKELLGGRSWVSTPVLAVAIVSYAGCLSAFVMATKWTTAANAIFLQYAGVIWVLLLSPVVLRERLTRADVMAVAAAFGGMALFFVGRLESSGLAGNLMALVSSVFFAVMILALRKEPGAGIVAVSWGNVLVVLAFGFFIPWQLPSRQSLLVLVLLGVFQIALPYYFFTRGIRWVPATQASLTGMIEPVANPIWVFLLLGERPAAFALLGGAIVLGAVVWRTLRGNGMSRAV